MVRQMFSVIAAISLAVFIVTVVYGIHRMMTDPVADGRSSPEARKSARRFLFGFRARPLLTSVCVLSLAWLLWSAGHWRAATLSWAGYDPDPDIGQAIQNDHRRAWTMLPFVAAAVIVDVVALFIAATAFDHRQHWALVLAALVLGLGSIAWHGLTVFVCLVLF